MKLSEKICGIYKIANKINGKVYIGQSQDIYARWYEHKRASKKRAEYALYAAFNKYGFDNFSFEILEKCSLEELGEKEIAYIAKFHSYVNDEQANGYNMTIGGAISHTHVGNDDQGRRVYQYDSDGNFIAEYRNQAKAAKAVGLKTPTSIQRAIKMNTRAGGYQWKDYKKKKITPFISKTKQKLLKVYQYTLEGDFIREFNSAQEAADTVGCSRSMIELCSAGKCKVGVGFRWDYKFYRKLPKLEPMVQPSKWKPVCQYDIQGNFIAEYPCAKIASEQTGVTISAMRHCLHGECQTAYGFIFKYK